VNPFTVKSSLRLWWLNANSKSEISLRIRVRVRPQIFCFALLFFPFAFLPDLFPLPLPFSPDGGSWECRKCQKLQFVEFYALKCGSQTVCSYVTFWLHIQLYGRPVTCSFQPCFTEMPEVWRLRKTYSKMRDTDVKCGECLGNMRNCWQPHLLSDTTCVTGSVVYPLVCLTCSVLCICPVFSQCYSVVIYTVSSGSPNVITCVVVGCGADNMPPSSWNW